MHPADLLLSAVRPGDIDRLLLGRRSVANASSVTFTAAAAGRTHTRQGPSSVRVRAGTARQMCRSVIPRGSVRGGEQMSAAMLGCHCGRRPKIPSSRRRRSTACGGAGDPPPTDTKPITRLMDRPSDAAQTGYRNPPRD